jgi:hypothetical protein
MLGELREQLDQTEGQVASLRLKIESLEKALTE